MEKEKNADAFLGITDVLALTSIKSKSTVYEMIRQGNFPRPYAISTARKAWSHRECQEWIEQCKHARK